MSKYAGTTSWHVIGKWVTGQKPPTKTPPGQKSPGQKPPDNKLPSIIEEIIAKYAVDANLFRLRSTNPNKKFSP